jgi:acetyl-CoA carboxylase biotin carboxylase subunit
LFKRILADEDFQSAAIDTGYLERLLEKPAAERAQEPALLDAATLAAAFYEGVVGASSDSPKAAAAGHPTPSRWKVAARAEGLR